MARSGAPAPEPKTHTKSNSPPHEPDKTFLRILRTGPVLALASAIILAPNPELRAAHFEDVSTASGIGQSSGGCFGSACGDFNNDGDPDLFLSNRGGPSKLWRNDGHGQFTAVSLGLPTEAGALHAVWADYDHDGDLDLAWTTSAETRVYRNEGGTQFVLAATLQGASGFPAWADYDNDGHVDLLAALGQDNQPQQAALYRNNGDGTFTRATDVFTEEPDRWTGPSWGDYDNDGFMDLLMLREELPNRLYHNVKNANHWLKFTLRGAASNRDGVGAKVRVLATIQGQPVWQMREVSGGCYAQGDSRPDFGLGDATQADRVIIEWPSGNVQEWTEMAVDQIFSATEQVRVVPNRPSASLNGSVTLTATL
jgi:hypothetical protein